MKLDWFVRVRFFTLVSIIFILISTACTPAAAPAAAPKVAAEATAAPAKVQEAAPTSAPAATATEAPAAAIDQPAAATPTSEVAVPEAPTATQAAASPASPAAAGPEVGAYCLPLDASVLNIKDPLNPPSNAKKVKVTANSVEISGLPSNGCVFYYTFTGAAPTGLKLEVSEPGAAKPFFKAELKPVDGKPESVWALVRHAMIVSPVSENMMVNFTVTDALGQVVRQDKTNLTSWVQGTPGPKNDDDDCGCDVPVLP